METDYEERLKIHNELMKDPKNIKKAKINDRIQWTVFILLGSGFLMLFFGMTWGCIFIVAFIVDALRK